MQHLNGDCRRKIHISSLTKNLTPGVLAALCLMASSNLYAGAWTYYGAVSNSNVGSVPNGTPACGVVRYDTSLPWGDPSLSIGRLSAQVSSNTYMTLRAGNTVVKGNTSPGSTLAGISRSHYMGQPEFGPNFTYQERFNLVTDGYGERPGGFFSLSLPICPDSFYPQPSADADFNQCSAGDLPVSNQVTYNFAAGDPNSNVDVWQLAITCLQNRRLPSPAQCSDYASLCAYHDPSVDPAACTEDMINSSQTGNFVVKITHFTSGEDPTCSGLSNSAYTWIESGYGTCSAICGGGVQTQTAVCQSIDGTVDPTGEKCGGPAPLSRACNTQSCSPEQKSLLDRLAELNQTALSCESQNNQAQAEQIAQLQAENTQLAAQLGQAQEKLAQSQAQLASVQAQNQQTLDSLNSQLASVNASLSACQVQDSKNQLLIQENQAQIATLMGIIAVDAQEIASLKSQVAELQSQIEALKIQVASLEAKLSTALAQLAASQAQVSALTKKVDSLETQIAQNPQNIFERFQAVVAAADLGRDSKMKGNENSFREKLEDLAKKLWSGIPEKAKGDLCEDICMGIVSIQEMAEAKSSKKYRSLSAESSKQMIQALTDLHDSPRIACPTALPSKPSERACKAQ